MTTALRRVTTVATFDLVDLPPMDSYLGPHATMAPYEAEVKFTDGDLDVIIVRGWIIGKHGRVTKLTQAVIFRPSDLTGEKPADADDTWIPLEVPAWVHQLPVRAAIGKTWKVPQ